MEELKPKLIKLHGPIEVSYIKLNEKEILLFGERHLNYNEISQNNIKNLIKIFADKSNIKKKCIDFFFESSFNKTLTSDDKINKKHEYSTSSVLNYLRDEFSYKSIYNTTEYNYFRVHHWELSQPTFRNIPTRSILFNEEMLPQIGTTYLSRNMIIYNFYCNNYSRDKLINDKFRELFISKKIFSYENELEISNIIHKQLNNIDEKYFCKEQLNDFFLNIISSNIGNIRLDVLETYSIARMFRKKFKMRDGINKCDGVNVDNIIYYGGNSHTQNVYNFLKTLNNYNCIYNYKIDDRYFRQLDRLSREETDMMTNDSIPVLFPLYNYFNLFDTPSEIELLLNKFNKIYVREFFPGSGSASGYLHLLNRPYDNRYYYNDREYIINTDGSLKELAFYNKYLKYKIKYLKLQNQLQII